MAGPIAIDTPDYQRGIINPQILLATVAPNVAAVTVSLPANTETLLVQCWGGVVDPRIRVVGTTTHYEYPGQKASASGYAFSSPTYLFDVSPALDSEVTVTFNSAPTAQWSVYADAGAHTVVDIGAYRDANGAQFMVPCAPSGGNWGHPPLELAAAGGIFAASGNMVAAPGAGLRIRVFALGMATTGAGNFASINNNLGGTPLLYCAGVGGAQLALPLTGYALSINVPLYVTILAGSMAATCLYTIETV